MKLVSIVIPTRNEEKALERLLKSLKKQTYKNYEAIVVDGGSTDKTIEIAKKYGAKVVKEYGRYRSPANARNIGVEKANGDIIVVFDCDSDVNNRFLEEGVKTFSSDKVMGARCSYVLAEDTMVEKILASKIKTHMDIVHSPAFTRKGFIKKMSGWDASLGYGEDKELTENFINYDEKHNNQSIKEIPRAVVKSHLPHTISELVAQQRWYGRTIFHYLKKGKSIKEYFPLLRVFYILVLFAVFMAVFQADFWLPALAVSAPFILLSIYRTMAALARGKIWGLGIFFIDIIMGFSFAYGLIESLFRKERGRD